MLNGEVACISLIYFTMGVMVKQFLRGVSLLYIYISVCLHSTQASSDSYVVVCYFPNWGQYRPSPWQYTVDHINASLCTHVVYAFAKIQGNNLAVSESNDIDSYNKLQTLKLQNAKLKTLLSVGGATGSAPFRDVASSKANREAFSSNVISYLTTHGFDGVDIDWEFPAVSEKDDFTKLIKELRKQINKEAAGKETSLLLTCALGAARSHITESYDLPVIAKDIDFANVMTYDLHGHWDKLTGFHAALHGYAEWDEFCQEWVVNEYIKRGLPREQIVLGIPTYGRTFTLNNTIDNGVRSSAIGTGQPGQYTISTGILSYYEICTRVNSGWMKRYDEVQKVPYAYQDDQWICYDDVTSVSAKANFVLNNSLAGVMFWDLSLEDFRGSCGDGLNPLLSTARAVLLDDTIITNPPSTVEISTQSITTEETTMIHNTSPASTPGDLITPSTGLESIMIVHTTTDSETISPQDASMTPSETPQDASMTPSETTQDVDMTPSETPQDVDVTPSEATQDASMTPSETPQDVSMTPSETSQDVSVTPSETPQDVSMTPSETPQDVSMTPSETPQDASMTPSETPQDVDMTPSETPQDVDVTPSETAQDVSMTPSETTQDVDATPSETPQDVDVTPSETTQDVSMTPSETPQDIDVTPSETPQDVDVTPSETPQDVSMTPSEATEDVNRSPDGLTPEETNGNSSISGATDGPSLTSSLPEMTTNTSLDQNSELQKKKRIIIGSSSGGAALLVLIVIVVVAVIVKQRRTKMRKLERAPLGNPPISKQRSRVQPDVQLPPRLPEDMLYEGPPNPDPFFYPEYSFNNNFPHPDLLNNGFNYYFQDSYESDILVDDDNGYPFYPEPSTLNPLPPGLCLPRLGENNMIKDNFEALRYATRSDGTLPSIGDSQENKQKFWKPPLR